MTVVLIGGCDRSGTTVLGHALGMPHAPTVPESHFLLQGPLKNLVEPDEASLDELSTALDSNFRYRLWGVSAKDVFASIPEGERITVRSFYSTLVRNYQLATTGSSCLEGWVDHTPSNMRNAVRLSRIFPEAKFIHILRDGRGVARSVLPLDWGPNTIERASRWWTERVGASVAGELAIDEGRVLRVRYEDLVVNPADTLSRIRSFLGGPWAAEGAEEKRDPETLTEYTYSQHSLVHRPFDPERARSWEKELTGEQVKRFESVGGSMLDSLGYERMFEPTCEPLVGLRRCAVEGFDTTKNYTVNRLRRSRRRSRVT